MAGKTAILTALNIIEIFAGFKKEEECDVVYDWNDEDEIIGMEIKFRKPVPLIGRRR